MTREQALGRALARLIMARDYLQQIVPAPASLKAVRSAIQSVTADFKRKSLK